MTVSPPAPVSLPAPVQAVFDATHAGDTAAFLDAFTADDGEHVVTVTVGGNGFNGPSHFSFRTDGARVSRMTIRA